MTEKRFSYKHFDWLQWHIFDNGDFYIEVTNCEEDAKKLCDLLNTLHEENERLKEYNNKLMKQPLLFDVQTIPDTMEIMEANTQLQKENKQLINRIKDLEELKRIYVDFLVSEGYELADVMKGDVE